MRVLVACESSGLVRDAFLARGHSAMSADLLETERPGPHYQGDVRDLLVPDRWDLMICHPPCTDLATSGARWFPEKAADGRQDAALAFCRELLTAPIPRIALENPRSIIGSRFRPADQLINPWQHGHREQKATCLWLVNLPLLRPTNVVPEEDRVEFVESLPPSEDRWRIRSRTFPGIAAAMADQWGQLHAVQGTLW